MRRLILLITALTTSCGIRPDHSEPALLELAETLNAQRAEVAEIWPGYPASTRDYFLFTPQRTLLIVPHDAPPSIALNAGPETSLAYIRAFEHAGRRGTAARLERSTAAALRTLLHEDFHEWQQLAFQNLATPAAAHSVTPEQYAAKLAELELLADALSNSEVIDRYIAVRAARRTGSPPDLVRVEEYFETIEGTAEHFGREAGALLSPASQSPTKTLQRFLRFEQLTGVPQTDYLRLYGYYTGAALAYLLDRRGVNWRSEVSAGRSLFELLARTSDVVPVAVDSSRHLATARRLFRKVEDAQEDFADVARYQLIARAEQIQYASGSVLEVSPGVSLLAPAQTLRAENGALVIEAEKTWAQFDANQDKLTVALTHQPHFRACTNTSNKTWRCTDGGELRTQRVRVSLTDGWCITQAERRYLLARCGD